MAKAFDATLKQLLDAFGGDWARFLAPRLGLPADIDIEPVDVDLSTVQFAADKVFRLKPPADGLLHLEPQASHDSTLADRLHVYSALLTDKYRRPVYSIALLLRPEANARHLTRTLERRRPEGDPYLRFRYGVVRIWELPCDTLLAGGPGLAPLALLTDEAADRLPEVVSAMNARMWSDRVPDHVRKLVLTSSFILLGLRYDNERIHDAFLRVQGMEESTTYQWILRQGRAEGRQEAMVETRRETLLAVLRERCGEVPADLEARISASTDAEALFDAVRRAVRLERIDDFVL